MTKSKIDLNRIDQYCQRLNATVPYPKTNEENQSYRDAFNSMINLTSVAIKSCHGLVQLNQNGNWNPFPTKSLLNAACEKPVIAKMDRFKRQAFSG